MPLQVEDTCPLLDLDNSLGILSSVLQQVDAKEAWNSQPCVKRDS